jgi:hypothetical protein
MRTTNIQKYNAVLSSQRKEGRNECIMNKKRIAQEKKNGEC